MHSVTQSHAFGHNSFRMAEPWRATSVTKGTRRTRPSGDFFFKATNKQTNKNLWIPHHHRGFSPLGSHRAVSGKTEWGGKNCTAEEQKWRVPWSELGMSSRPENSSCWLTQGESMAFPGKCCSHISILSPHLEKELLRVLTGLRKAASPAAVPVWRCQHCSAPLRGAEASPEFQRVRS